MELLLLFGLGLQGFDAELQLAGVLLVLHKDTRRKRDERNFLAATAILRSRGQAVSMLILDRLKVCPAADIPQPSARWC